MLKPRFKAGQFEKQLAAYAKKMDQAIINRLIYVGESFVRNARLNGNYADHTGNLRSSIGYIILKNGRTINQLFEEADKGNDKKSGVKAGARVASELKKRYPNGYVLIVVAGMNYAAAVESKGKDVITGSSKQAEAMLESFMNKLKR